jgi:hypothetical protein
LYDGVLIALADAGRSFHGHELVASVVANDCKFATTQPLTHRVISWDVTYLIAIDEIVSLVCLSPRQAVLLDQLRNLRLARFPLRLLDVLSIQRLIMRSLGELGVVRSELRRRGYGTLLLGSLLTVPLLLPQLSLGLLGLLLGSQASL